MLFKEPLVVFLRLEHRIDARGPFPERDLISLAHAKVFGINFQLGPKALLRYLRIGSFECDFS